MTDFDFERLAAAESTDVASALANFSCADLSAEILVFLICRNYRVALVHHMMSATSEESREWALLVNEALLHVFINGDWDEPSLEQNSRPGPPPRLWPGTIGPISVSMAETARFLGNVARHCPAIWSWKDEKPFITRYLDAEYRYSMFNHGEQEDLTS